MFQSMRRRGDEHPIGWEGPKSQQPEGGATQIAHAHMPGVACQPLYKTTIFIAMATQVGYQARGNTEGATASLGALTTYCQS